MSLTIRQPETHNQTIINTPAIPTKIYSNLSNQTIPKVIQLTILKPKIPTESQLIAPMMVKISAITENTLKVFFKMTPPCVFVTLVFAVAKTIYAKTYEGSEPWLYPLRLSRKRRPILPRKTKAQWRSIPSLVFTRRHCRFGGIMGSVFLRYG